MSNFVVAVIEGLIASILYSAIGGLVVLVVWITRSRYHRQIWRDAVKFRSDCLIVLSSRVVRSDGKGETPRCSASEVRALTRILVLLRRFRVNAYFRLSDDVSNDELGSHNLVVLGSEKENSVAARALNSLGLPGLSFDPVARVIKVGERVFEPQVNANTGVPVRDYALIVRATNPFRHRQDKRRSLIMFMGCYGIGTDGAVQAAIDRRALATLASKTNSRDFIAIVRVHIDGFLVTNTAIEMVLGYTNSSD